MVTQRSGASRGRAPSLPAPPSSARRITAAVLDALLALVCGLTAGAAAGVKVVDGVVELRPSSPSVWGAAVGALLAVSFVNHVLLTLAARASVGKLLTGLRVVRVPDSDAPASLRRPPFLRLIGRWLFGFYWTVVFVPIHLAADSDVEQQDAVGLRVVRRHAS
ncbi:RDD family protein [Streptomyces flavofungini]|uniref:RDD family protein n=1 Tax=Streptomyces flavofungini TaxID=68200 RepID=UPI0025AFA50A|nr:RDD family protein [Streptomyces flavofungini]WJV46910.1 RDD family protein [Streptomyces flavofungini]